MSILKLHGHVGFSVLVVLLAGVFSACDQADFSTGGAFEYRATDGEGETVVSGMLELRFGEPPDLGGEEGISGTWILELEKGGAEVGPQTGSGDIAGSIDQEGNIWMDLNPGWADNNVFLSGSFSDERYGDFSGTWMYSTLVGPTAEGSFKAERD